MKGALLLFGILIIPLCDYASAQDYHVYVDELPDYAGYAANVMYESTLFWQERDPDLEFYLVDDPTDADFRVQWVKEFGVEHVGYAYGSQFIEVGLGDSDCTDSWAPYSANYVAHIMKHEIGHVLGLGHTDDPNSIMYPIALYKEYGLIEKELPFVENYGYFMTFCTSKDVTSFDYHVSTDDPVYGFDVHVVPNKDSLEKRANGDAFEHYMDDSCHGKDYLSYGGRCEGVARESGLMIFTGDTLTNPLTTITVSYEEVISKDFDSGIDKVPSKPRDSESNLEKDGTDSTSIPQETPSNDSVMVTDAGTITMDSDVYTVGYSDTIHAKISGTVTDSKQGDRVTITWTHPSGETSGNIVVLTDKGRFESLLTLNGKSPKGTYEALVSSKQKIIGILRFDVVEKSTEPSIAKPANTLIQDTVPPDFADFKSDPYHHVNRYNAESEYREWFEGTYPGYTIYDATGIAGPESIPSWVRDNARLWSDGAITDDIFISGISYMITRDIIIISSDSQSPTAHDGIPSWVKRNASLWYDKEISNETFLQGIKYLVERGIIPRQ